MGGKKNKSGSSKKGSSSGRSTKKRAAASSPASTSFSALPSATLLSSVLVVFVAMAIAGGFHLRRSGDIDTANNESFGVTDADSNPNQTEATTATRSTGSTSSTSRFSSDPLVAGHEVSIAIFHDIQESLGDLTQVSDDVDKSLKDTAEKQRSDLMAYISYDDGYAACLTPDSGGESDMFGVRSLKKLKYEFLQRVANRREFWTVRLVNAQRATGDELLHAAEHLRTMCRLMTLTHEDYDGRAKAVLQKAMDKGDDMVNNFTVKSQGPASDYRTTVCLHRLTDEAFHATAATREEKLAKTALTKLRYEWAKDINDLKTKALAEPPRPMPEGWTVHREEENGHLFYQNKATGKSSWVRPVPVFGGKGVIVDFPPPAKNGKNTVASIIARRKPCPIEDTIAVLNGLAGSANGESSSANLKVSAIGGPDAKKNSQSKVTVTKKATGGSSGGADFKVTANGGNSGGATFSVKASGRKGESSPTGISVTVE
mmetsp:Transcript_1501/g.3198  ORF Transcript_1501/g.3198 Transcript_1501/m.3198 type:complete len:486 (+) Transcript_1501:150-1607(+)